MGAGNSRERYEPKPGRRSAVTGRGVRRIQKRRRGFFGKMRSAPTTQPIIPIKYPHYHRYSYGSYPFAPPITPYPQQQQIFQPSMPMPYNNYASPAAAYMPSRQPMMFSPQQMLAFQQMMMQQQMPQSYPMMMQQQIQQPQPAMMPQQVFRSPPMMMPQQVQPSMFSPYMYSPFSMGAPLSTPYAQQPQPQQRQTQQQPHVQPFYNNNIGASAPPASAHMTGPAASYRAATVNLGTDWTGGGKISPGFLGPPI